LVTAWIAVPAQASTRPVVTVPSLEIQAPAHVVAGQAITVTIAVRGARSVAGWEARVRFDSASAEFAGASGMGRGIGRSGGQLGPVSTSDGIAVGGYTSRARSSRGLLTLVRVRLLPRVSGTFGVSVGDLRLVDRTGHRLRLDSATQTVTVRVGSGGDRHAAPPANRLERIPVAAHASRSRDLDGDGLVLVSDLAEASRAWDAARETGVCAPAGDVNRNGCADVSDVVRVAHAVRPRPFTLIPSADGLFVVDSTGDEPDATPGDTICQTVAGTCTLRAAMTEATRHAGADTIAFNLPGTGPQTIVVSSQLPTLSDTTGPTTIDGYTQPGSAPNTSASIDNAVLRVQVRGTGATLAYYMFFITSPNNVIRGLSIFDGRAMAITGANARTNRIVGNFLGTDAAGTFAFADQTRNCATVEIARGASQNHIGDTTPADRNVISGSAFTAVYFTDNGTSGNVVQNNIIGLTPSGATRLRNQRMGVDINLGASTTLVGGTGPGERNVISGNRAGGVEVSHTTATVGNQVIGNFIGTDVTGNRAPAFSHNSEQGVHLEDGVQNTVVSGNVIGDNFFGGVIIDGP